ncbi:hypothetical protein QUF72_01020 [Desulfobacterales bacterium HSG2]|nr:hypothetical protein [Desulfobacterales bacterium HSG2]
MDIEYQLEELKKDIQSFKPAEELIEKTETIEDSLESLNKGLSPCV